jgi:hypothetical protein
MNEFGRLLEKEIPRLRRYAFALTRNMSRADDLVQDTLVRAIASNVTGSGVPTFAPGSSPLCITRMQTSSDIAHAKAAPSRSTMRGHSP